MFVGEMVGYAGGGVRGEGKGVKIWRKGEERRQFLHDEESFAAFWQEVADSTGTTGQWKVESRFKARGKKQEDLSKGFAFFVGEGVGWITFSVERI